MLRYLDNSKLRNASTAAVRGTQAEALADLRDFNHSLSLNKSSHSPLTTHFLFKFQLIYMLLHPLTTGPDCLHAHFYSICVILTQEYITSWSSHIILIHHPPLKEEGEGEAHIMEVHCGEECHWIWVFFHGPASFVCRLRKSIVWQTPWEKRRAWSRCLPVLLQRSGPKKTWMKLCHRKQPARTERQCHWATLKTSNN